MLKQQLDFPFDKRIETSDRFKPQFKAKKFLKLRIDWLNSTAKQPLKRRLNFVLKKAMLKQASDFPFQKKIETTDRLPTIEGQKIVKTTVIFSF